MIDDEGGLHSNHDIPFSVVSWNCLADCYSRGPCAESEEAVSWKYRSKLITAILRSHDPDILCLQEVDKYDDYMLPFLKSNCYHVEFTKRGNRQDGILIAYKQHKFHLVRRSVLQYDDLSHINPVPSPLSVESLRKHNVALILCLHPIAKPLNHTDLNLNSLRNRPFVVCTTHLYWNPLFSQVKLAQTHYLLEYLTNFRCYDGEFRDLPPCAVLLTGDFNSEPPSRQYQAITRGKPVHPIAVHDRAEHTCRAISLAVDKSGQDTMGAQHDNHQVADDGVTRFLCDATLSKLARWLRLLGVDTAIEDKQSQERRAFHNDFTPLFLRASQERRILVTTSANMQKRNTCPETFLIRTSSSSEQLKSDLAALLIHYGVQLDKSSIFTICGKCGGQITSTESNDDRLSGRFVPSDRQLFICNTCRQPYWFSDRSEGCSSRARKLAYTLFAYVEAVSSSSRRSKKSGRKSSSSREDDEYSQAHSTENTLLKRPLPEVDPCRKQWLAFQSVFRQVHGKEPDCTNINGSYRGTLDYIFVAGAIESRTAQILRHQYVGEDKEQHELYPNSDWPSDHFMVCADVVLRTKMNGRAWLPRSHSTSSNVGQRYRMTV